METAQGVHRVVGKCEQNEPVKKKRFPLMDGKDAT